MARNHEYFLHRSESTGSNQRLTSIIAVLNNEFASYKFTVYRCAAKIHALQKALFTSEIPYKLVLSVLERHRLSQSDETISVRPAQLTPIIHDIFFACDKLGHFAQQTAFDLEITTSVLANFFWDVFDVNRTSPISLLEVKETFLLLCQVNSLEELISEYFLLAADHNKCISRFRLESVLKILAKILTYLGESGSYGAYTIPEIVEQCFAQCPGINGINEYQFNCLWSTTSNRFMIYANLLALVKRMKDTEQLIHSTACISCQSQEIIGIRFKCYTCRDLSLCMKCFSIGFSNSKHSLNHRVYEVYSDDVPSKKWTHYLTKLCNIVFRKNNQTTKEKEPKSNDSYKSNTVEMLENQTSMDESLPVINVETKGTQCTGNSDSVIEPNIFDRSLLEKLTNIIATLFEQREKLEKRKQCLQRSDDKSKSICDLLNDQESILLTVIEQLKFILENSQFPMLPVSSTPNRILGYRRMPADTSSPLSRSLHGASINKSYLEANKSDFSIGEMSTWFHGKQSQQRKPKQLLNVINETTAVDTDMMNFRDLLSKVKEIVDDSYSDNNELAEATYHLETVLDSIIRDEEMKRHVS